MSDTRLSNGACLRAFIFNCVLIVVFGICGVFSIRFLQYSVSSSQITSYLKVPSQMQFLVDDGILTWNGAATTVVVICAIALAIAFVSYLVDLRHLDLLKRSGIYEIDQMGGVEFERYLAAILGRLGYSVEQTPYRNDYGADLIVRMGDRRIVIQAKRYSKNVPNDAIQEVHAAWDYYHATEAWAVTNSHFTSNARNLAARTGVRIIEREELIAVGARLNSSR